MRCHVFLSHAFVHHPPTAPGPAPSLGDIPKAGGNEVSAGFHLVMRSVLPSSWLSISWLALGRPLQVFFVGHAGRGQDVGPKTLNSAGSFAACRKGGARWRQAGLLLVLSLSEPGESIQ